MWHQGRQGYFGFAFFGVYISWLRDLGKSAFICYKSALLDTSKKLRFNIYIFNSNCAKEGHKFDYSEGMMHAFTQ